MKSRILIMIILVMIILITGCISQVYTAEEAEETAVEYIRNAPTFHFDGIEKSLEATNVESLDCTGCFEVTVEFDCRNEGFGDRSGLFLKSRFVHHTAKVRVEKGEVTQAIIDEIWDEMAQEGILE
ncbi:MAG: hypothetical protein HXS46_14935 [Theionarchaea archaeon]|nr:MAG: hypothetical protein AYK18_16695 [Theionarchaea archaeon DG-70]MBU7011977.1 hypothetical protein [Theionarchaea archaeon]